MPPPESLQGRPKRSGQWFVAAPPNWPLDDLAIVREVDGEIGVDLLLGLYNLRLYAETPHGLRDELFTPPTNAKRHESAPGRIKGALDLFSDLLRSPTRISEPQLTAACRAVAEWAEDHSYSITAITYAEVAARLLQEDAEMANLAGRACRRAGERARAELWYERGGGLARRAGDAKQYVDSHLGYGNLLRDFGEYGRALHWIKRAGVSARKQGLRESGAEALHDAFTLAYLREDLVRASSLVRRAARLYPIHARRVPYFGADLALLLARRGLYDLALELLQIVQLHLTGPVEALQVWGLVAYAAGGAGDREMYTAALRRVEEMAEIYAESSAGALAYAAAGANLMQDWDTADRMIAEATRRGAGDRLSEDLAARVARDVATRTVGGLPSPENDPSIAALRGIVPDIAWRLRRWRGPTWRPRKK
jgi:tetratricopeptide (TPR) repeat protein